MVVVVKLCVGLFGKDEGENGELIQWFMWYFGKKMSKKPCFTVFWRIVRKEALEGEMYNSV